MALKLVSYGNLSTSSGAGTRSVLYEVHTAVDGQTTIVLHGSYTPGAHELQVYLNGVRQTLDIDYIEVDFQTIAFLYPLEDGDRVLLEIPEVRNTRLYEKHEAYEGQTIFTLSSPYRIGANTLMVFEEGVQLSVNDDYIEVDEFTVEFLNPLPAGTKVIFREIV